MSTTEYRADNIFLPLLQQSTSARAIYDTHRTTRNAVQRALLLDPSVPLVTDPVLSNILSTTPPDWFRDTRHNMCVWARPTAEVIDLVASVQARLLAAVGDDQGIWFPPPAAQHMTLFEVTNGLTADALRAVEHAVVPHVARLTALPTAPVVLDAPALNLDVSGIALSFLPRDGALLELRAREWDIVARAGVQVQMRYALPSAHITVGRFVARGHGLAMSRDQWVRLLDSMNNELEKWVGEWKFETLTVRSGVQWYGGGYSLGDDGALGV